MGCILPQGILLGILQKRLLDHFHKKIQFWGQPFSFSNSFQAKCRSESWREPIVAAIPTGATQQKLWRLEWAGVLGDSGELCSLPASPLTPWLTLHRRIQRSREAHQHTPAHSASRWQSWDWNPRLSDSPLLTIQHKWVCLAVRHHL